MPSITVYSCAGTGLHSIMCDAFLAWGGYVLIEMDHLYRIVSMETAADGERTLWRLYSAPHAGRA